MDDASLTGAITGLYDLLEDLRETIFATSLDRRNVADALYDAIDAARRREIAVREDVSSRMDRFATREARESAGNAALLKDEEYAALQRQVMEQRHLLAFTDALLERKKGEYEEGLKMLDLLLVCARSSGLAFNGELGGMVRGFIENVLADDPVAKGGESPAVGTDLAPSRDMNDVPGLKHAGEKESPAPAAPGAADEPVRNALRGYFKYHGTMTLTDLRKLAGVNGFSEEDVKEVLRDLFLSEIVDYYEATETTEACWRLVSPSAPSARSGTAANLKVAS